MAGIIKHISIPEREDITIGQYYFANFYLSEIYSPAGFVAFGLCSALFFKRLDIAVGLFVIAAFAHAKLTWIHDRYVRYFNSMGATQFVRYDWISGVLILGLILFVAYISPEKINKEELMWVLGGLVLSVLSTVVLYVIIWPRLATWYGLQDRDVFAQEYEASDEEKAKGRKLSKAAAREQLRQQLWRRKERRYVGRLKRYKCCVVLPKNVILLNIAIFYFAIDGRLETDAQAQDVLRDIGFIDGLMILTILAVSHFGWWLFIRNDERVEDAVCVMGTAPRMFIDMEWFVTLLIIPCGLLGYSLLFPATGMLPWQSGLYVMLAMAQFLLFWMYLYPGRAPE